MHIPTEEEFCEYVVSQLRERGIAESTFGRVYFNDPNLMRELRAGRSPHLDMARDIVAVLTHPDVLAAQGLERTRGRR